MEASLPDPQVEPIVEVVLAWATTQPIIRAVALVGSHARGTARRDSDHDLVLLTTDPDSFRVDATWVTQIDWHAIGIRPQRWQDEQYGARPMLMCIVACYDRAERVQLHASSNGFMRASAYHVARLTYPGREHGFDFSDTDPMTADAVGRVVRFFEAHLLAM